MYERVRWERKDFQPRLCNVRSDTGEMLTEEEEITDRWRIYFENVLNGGRKDWTELQADQTMLSINTEETDTVEEEVELTPLEPEEVIKALNSVKNGKDPGEDAITAELLKNVGRECQLRMCNLILEIWKSETMPEKWKRGMIIPIHKKGSRSECTNYRPITLLNTTYKILSKLINRRLKDYAEKRISDYQCGFRPNRSTIDHIFTIR